MKFVHIQAANGTTHAINPSHVAYVTPNATGGGCVVTMVTSDRLAASVDATQLIADLEAAAT